MILDRFLQPKWQDPDPAVRLSSIADLDPDKDRQILINLATRDAAIAVRSAVVEKLCDEEGLRAVAAAQTEPELIIAIERKLNQICHRHALANLGDVAVVQGAAGKITDEKLLADIATRVGEQNIKLELVRRIAAESLLARITEAACGVPAGVAAVEKIQDEAVLKRVSERASNKGVRAAADAKLQAIFRAKHPPTEEEIRAAEFQSLYDTATSLQNSWNWEYVNAEITKARSRWNELDPAGKHPSHAEFTAACDRFLRRLGEFQQTQQDEQAKKDHRDRILAERKRLCERVESCISRSDDSVETDVQQAQSQWRELESIPDEPDDEDWHRFRQACSAFASARKQRRAAQAKREREIRILTDLCVSAESAAAARDWRAAAEELKTLAKRWEECAAGVADVESLTNRFRAAMDSFQERRTNARTAVRNRIDESIAFMRERCQRLDELMKVENRLEAEKEVKEIQRAWAAHSCDPKVPEAVRKGLERRYKKACDRFYQDQREFRDQIGWERWANTTTREELCAAAAALANEADVNVVFATLKELEDRWQGLGPNAKYKDGRLYRQFNGECDRQYQRCREFFAQVERQRAENGSQKERICKKMEQILAAESVLPAAAEVAALQERWRGIGEAPTDQQEAIESRFSALCKRYDDARQRQQRALEEEENRNIDRKTHLCAAVVALMDTTDWPAAIEAVDVYRQEWEEASAKTTAKDEELRQAFFAAVDRFRLRVEQQRAASLEQKQKLLGDLQATLSACSTDEAMSQVDVAEIAKRLFALQQRWLSLGPIPADQEAAIKDALFTPCTQFFQRKQRFHRAAGKKFAAIQAAAEEILFHAASLRERLDWDAIDRELATLRSRWKEIVDNVRDQSTIDAYEEQIRYFDNRRSRHGHRLEEQRLANARKKEELCVRLELVTRAKSTGDSTISLAEQLQMAFESNFVMASPTRDGDGWHRACVEVEKIQSQWKQVGPAPKESEHALNSRYNAIREQFFSRRPPASRDQGVPARNARSHRSKGPDSRNRRDSGKPVLRH